ncbi:NAD(P)-binding protein [Apiospora arundinis]
MADSESKPYAISDLTGSTSSRSYRILANCSGGTSTVTLTNAGTSAHQVKRPLGRGRTDIYILVDSANKLGRGQLAGSSAAYGPSKAAAHWLTKRINTEEDKVTAFVLHPGWVATDMGNRGANRVGLAQAPTSVQESVDGMLRIIDSATKETTGATFHEFNGNLYPW